MHTPAAGIFSDARVRPGQPFQRVVPLGRCPLRGTHVVTVPCLRTPPQPPRLPRLGRAFRPQRVERLVAVHAVEQAEQLGKLVVGKHLQHRRHRVTTPQLLVQPLGGRNRHGRPSAFATSARNVRTSSSSSRSRSSASRFAACASASVRPSLARVEGVSPSASQ